MKLKGKEPKKAASHNTPVTVAAETGLVGLGLFVWLIVTVLLQAFRRRGQTALVAGLGIAAILCHSLFYNAFFEDPLTWALFGLVALAARIAAPTAEPEPPAVPAKEAVPV